MSKTNYTPWIILGAVVLLLLMVVGWLISGYNGLVSLDEGVAQKWANVESAYQRRADLIPNLVDTVKGAGDFESETLQAVIDARSKASSVQLDASALSDPQAVANFQAAQGEVSSALSRLLVTVERYPQLQATQAYRDLMVSLEGTENRIKVERDNYNVAVRAYNVKVRSVPTNIIAGMFGFDKKELFSSDEGADVVPDVEF